MDLEKYSRWTGTEAGWKVLRGNETVTLRKPGRVTKTRDQAMEMSEADAALLDDLKSLRRDLAKERDVPAYVIFADRTLIEMASSAPVDANGLRDVHGVGEKKIERYGEVFLSRIKAHRQRSAAA